MAYYGRRITSNDPDFGVVSDTGQRASVFNAMPENGWGFRVGLWCGIESGSPSVQLGVWEADSGMNPAARMGYGVAFSPAAPMTSWDQGQAYQALFALVDSDKSPGGGSTLAIKMIAGKRYGIGPQVNGGSLGHGMRQASGITADNEQFYNRSGTATPSDPFGYTSASVEGHLSAWVEYQANRAPTADVVSPAGTINTTSPTFKGDFNDADEVYGDRLTKFRIQVYRISDGALMWDSGQLSATSSEKSAGQFSRPYDGNALSAGVQYRTRCQVADEFGEWSAWTGYTVFTVNGGGIVNLTSPTGKQENRQPGPIVASWVHNSALATNTVELRIRDSTGAVIKQSGTLANTTANNGTISIPWNTAFGSTYFLSWGSDYTIEMRARDTGNLWSDWDGIAVHTDAAPSIPSNLTPANSAASSSRPKLVCKCSDVDDTVATGLMVKCEILNNAGSLISTRVMTLKSGTTDTWEYQTTASDLASFGSFRWRAYAGDGTIWSGEQTSEASATRSAEATFVYANGPQIAHVSPADGATVTTGTPLYDWTVTFSGATQVSYQVLVYRSDDGFLVHDSGTVSDTTASQYQQPSGKLRDGTTYYRVIKVTDSNGLTGQSEPATFTLDYIEPPAPSNFIASPELLIFDTDASSARLTWDASTEPNFLEWIIGRRETGDDPDNEIILARLPSPSTTDWIDYFPPSGVDVTYSIRQSTIQGLDVTTSQRSEAQLVVTLDHVVICHAFRGGDYRVGLHLDAEREADHLDDLVLEMPWGEGEPFGMFGTADYQVFSGTFKLVSDDLATARAYIQALRTLKQQRSTMCYRDERGRKMFCVITKFREKDQRVQTYTVDLELTEVAHDEGVD
jgi:hypothetical protein